ncbi:MAG: acetoacetate--CoA ligase [Gammaproteobacteria bacterium]|nr:acetoacetate--CoA ligase [Gammaproteobacteria bacterium]
MSILWRPDEAGIARSRLTAFARDMATRHGAPTGQFDALWRWTLRHPAEFWRGVADATDVIATRGSRPVLQFPERMHGALWFEDWRLNFAENLLRRRDSHPVVVALDESGRRRELSGEELADETARIAAALRALGVGPGDRVAGYLPNIPEAVIAMLATTSIGAVWSSCSPDFGLAGALDRFGQIAPKVLIAADGYRYGGRAHDSLATAAALLAQLPGLRALIVGNLLPVPDLAAVPGALSWDAFPSQTGLAFTDMPFNAPLYVLYSSGTTGKPKCIVHGAGGTLLQHRKEHALHVDLRADDVIFWFTTTGWMMWNWLVSALAEGSTIVLYDGSPTTPDEGVLWRLAEREEVTVFGTSPRYLAAIEKAGYHPGRRHNLARLRSVLSTGAPLAPAQFDFVYSAVKPDVTLASMSGGTDIVSCFVLGNPWQPVTRGEIQGPGLGMAVDVVNDAGDAVTGEPGELVCRAPFPSMPLGFFGDHDGSRYRAAYFERFPGLWHHGDYATRTPGGGYVISGRSDTVLNPGGVRIGTAEIYRIVDALDEVQESVAVGQDWQGDVRIVLFVRLKPDCTLDEALAARIRDALRRNASPRHVPAKILAVSDIPRTLSGKLSEAAVREAVHGRPVKHSDALANPGALDEFRDRSELAS